jgi:hypothetical protein
MSFDRPGINAANDRKKRSDLNGTKKDYKDT